MAATVVWRGRASSRIRKDLLGTLTADLKRLFSELRVKQIIVNDCLKGYSDDQDEKVVLGVEVILADSYSTHIVKIGSGPEVAADYDGWKKCVANEHFSSRVLVRLTKKRLSHGRHAVIYEDAYNLFGADGDSHQRPESLETVVHKMIDVGKPDPASVERVICQIFGELHTQFYRAAETDTTRAAAFFKRKLAPVGDSWSSDPARLELRRDAIWVCCPGQPISLDEAWRCHDFRYLDAADFVGWSLKCGKIPPMLVGPSHGDVHGRNILIGVRRGEAEYPTLFDYGEMRNNNVVAWDFVKLETELKVRVLPLLLGEGSKRALADHLRRPLRPDPPSDFKITVGEVDPVQRANRLEFAYAFEQLLAHLTNQIKAEQDAECRAPPSGRVITGHAALDRAVCLILRIRQEAALWLGHRRAGRRRRWGEEYYFALAAYGLRTAKWDYDAPQTEWALVSAGVATAQLGIAATEINKQIQGRPQREYASYCVPLVRANGLWRAGKSGQALKLLEQQMSEYRHAVPLWREYALVLADTGELARAQEETEKLRRLCHVFRDHETLSRLGKTFKALGDQELERFAVDRAQLIDECLPAWQYYVEAYAPYKEAFDITGHYFPGINAATLAFLIGDDGYEEIATNVRDTCQLQHISASGDERFWIFATEGEVSLLLRNTSRAVTCYDAAVRTLGSDQKGMLQSAYNQVCRLWWALGEEAVDPVVAVFAESPLWDELDPGPLGDCGYV